MKSKAKLFSKSLLPSPVRGYRLSRRVNPASLAWLGGIGAALVLMLAAAPRSALAQATPNPPDRLTYQGFLVDANGVALGATAPKNYDVIFRIWNDQNSSDTSHRLWTEQQTVTVDKGYFSVLLGEGSQYSTEPHPSISSLFAAPDASDRYVEITVKGIGSGSPAGDVTIQPRLRLLTSPYAFLAEKAVHAASLVNNSNAPIVSASGTSLTINGSATANSFSGNGAGLTSLNAGNITSGTLSDLRLTANVALRNADQTFTGHDIFSSLSLSESGNLRLNDQPIYIRGGSDQNHYLAYNSSVDGPELRGWSGGFLSTGNGGIHNALRWDTTTVTVNGKFSVNSTGYVSSEINSANVAGTWLSVGNSSSGGTNWHLISTGNGNGEGPGKLLIAPGPVSGSINTTVLALTPSGLVGVGTSTPSLAQLEVRGNAVNNNISTYGYINRDGAGNIVGFSGVVPFSIYTDGRIAAPELNAFSDARIKNIKGPTDSAQDLQTLLGIQITDYTMVDTVANGNRPHKKVIAQQVEKVFPEAVSSFTNVVPDIYTKSDAQAGWIPLTKQLNPALKIGDQVRLITEKNTALHEVTEVNAYGFRVKDAVDGPVFVYGRQVGDFRTVDYSAISMLNVSATQELYRELQDKDAKIQELQAQLNQVTAQEQSQAARLDKLESVINQIAPAMQSSNSQ
jgi:hypothetical protein